MFRWLTIVIVSPITLLTALTLCLAGCGHKPWMYEDRHMQERDSEDISELIWDWAVNVQHEKKLFLDDAQIITGPDQTKLRFQFHSQSILEMCEARHLLVDIAEALLDRVNIGFIGERLRPQPFTADQLEIYIDFQSYYVRFVDPFYIGWVVLENGWAFYYAATVKDEDHLCQWEVRREPYFKSRSFSYLQRESEKNYELLHPTPQSALSDEWYIGRGTRSRAVIPPSPPATHAPVYSINGNMM